MSWTIAQGLGLLFMFEPEWTIRLRYVGGAATQLDCLMFQSEVPVRESTWGAIKTRYRD